MPGFVVRPPRARRVSPHAARNQVLRLAPVMLAPAAAGVVLLAEAAAVVRLVVGVPRLAAPRPTGSRRETE
jgi:hypothetical protein